MAGFNGTADAGTLHTSDVVNNLTSTDPTKVLAAPQGKALNDTINALFNGLRIYIYGNVSSITFTLPKEPSNQHFGSYLLFNANQALLALIKAEISPNVYTINGNITFTISISGKNVTVTPSSMLWGMTVVIGSQS